MKFIFVDLGGMCIGSRSCSRPILKGGGINFRHDICSVYCKFESYWKSCALHDISYVGDPDVMDWGPYSEDVEGFLLLLGKAMLILTMTAIC